MKRNFKYFLGFIIVFQAFQMRAQDPHFSQYYANPLYLNPAFAGVDKSPTVHLNYRNQYPQLGVYNTFSASFDGYVEGINGGLGVMAMRDEAAQGNLSLTEVSALYSYHLTVNRKFTLLSGFQATFRQRQLDWYNLTFPDMIDQFYGFVKPTNEIPPENTTNQHLDLSFGMIGYTEKFYIGAAAHHLTQPNEAFLSNNKLPLKFTAHAGLTLQLGRRRLYNSTDNLLIIHAVYQNQGPFSQLTSGLSFNRGPITGGLALRTSLGTEANNPDAVIIILGLAPEKSPYTIGYSYDYTISAFTNVTGGAHEITFSYKFPCIKKKKGIKPMKCPKF
jgi:type IX secretion system PorP/SprF family membrane protein